MRPLKVEPVKLFVSVISKDEGLIDKALGALKERFGNAEYLSPVMPFDYTDYYEKEMGRELLRKIASFERTVSPGELPDIKMFTNAIEDSFLTENGLRRINIDPGYLTLHNLVLASCKDFSHRVYLKGGVYGEVTLVFRHGEYAPLEWTYPDYRGEKLRGIFKEIRKVYQAKLKNGGKDAQ